MTDLILHLRIVGGMLIVLAWRIRCLGFTATGKPTPPNFRR